MRKQRLLAAILVSAFCLAGAGWTLTRLRSPHQLEQAASREPVPDGASLRLAGVLAPAAAVPIEATIVELDVPLNSWVRKGQVIGESDEGAAPDPSSEWEARRRLSDAEAALAEAREQLRAIESMIGAARASSMDMGYRLVTAGVSEVETENAIARSNRLYRQGMESELEHDDALALRRAALQQADLQRSRAGLAAAAVDELEVRRLDAQADLREAQGQRRIAEAAVPNPRGGRGRVPVVSPADGLLVMRAEYPGAFEIAPDSRRMVVNPR